VRNEIPVRVEERVPSPRPTVSIVMPTFNRRRYIVETVRSVQAQTLEDWELIAVDDGSTDDTLAALAALGDPRIRCFSLPHSGYLARIRNVGVQQARGTYVAFQDSDDLWLPHKLALQLERVREHPDWRWSYTSFRLIDGAGDPYPTADPRFGRVPGTPDDLYRRLLAHEVIITTSTLLIERSLLDEIGGFNDSLRRAAEFDLAVRLSKRSPAAAIVEPVVLLRRHPGSASTDRAWVAESLARTFERYERETQDEETRALCRRQLARHSLDLADAHLRDRHLCDGLRALATATRAGSPMSKALRIAATAVARNLRDAARRYRR
jgi:glycosyltransferase involved in cell wall biosynthesis